MATVSTEALTLWENPSSISTPADQLRIKTDSFASHIESADSSWAGLPGAYTGPEEGTFFNALSPAVGQAGFIRDAGSAAESALSDFATSLQTLIDQRIELIAEVGAFNSEFSGTSSEDLDGQDVTAKNSLQQRVTNLQQQYENLVSTCVTSLGNINVGSHNPGSSGDGPNFESTGDQWGDAAQSTFGSPATIAQVAMDGVQGPSARYQGAYTTVGQRGPGGSGWNATAFQYSARTRGWSAYGIPLGQAPTPMAPGPQGPAIPGTTQTYTALSHSGLDFRNGTPGMSSSQAWANHEHSPNNTVRSSGTSHSAAYADGSYRSQGNFSAHHQGGANTINNVNNGIRVGGHALTVLGAAATFTDQREQNQIELAAENPGMSDEEIASEATHDAAANTAGQTGTVAAATAAGAAAGSLIPVPGVGTLLGAGAGFLASAPILPDVTGDGQNDSIASAVGHYTEQGWDWIRNDGVDMAQDFGESVVDGVGDAVDTVKESNLNPMNWF